MLVVGKFVCGAVDMCDMVNLCASLEKARPVSWCDANAYWDFLSINYINSRFEQRSDFV